MKKIITFTLLLISLQTVSLYAQIDWDAVKDRYVEKYQPEKIPKWIFPMIFENGVGDRDTIYLNYDPESDGFWTGHDSIYGQRYTPLDTSIFKVYLDRQTINDTIFILDTYITPYIEYDDLSVVIDFDKGILPVKAYFNTQLFRSDSLPLITEPHLPQLQGELWEHSLGVRIGEWNYDLDQWEDFCFFDIPTVLTDTSNFADCPHSDSVYIDDIPDNIEFKYLGSLQFFIKQWRGRYVSVQDSELQDIKLYPNPSDDLLTLQFDQAQTGQYQIFNSSGKRVLYAPFNEIEQLEISTAYLPQGLYYLRVVQEEQITTSQKIIVLH